ncbi:MAG TPA: HAMP domain-containing sensor histidine kinase [Marmoricola sp.]|nr:HAMP domain-containing sensor histidine kinase [Marmoricola sp.]
MTHDQVQIVLIAAAWSGGVGVLGLTAMYAFRRRSVRWLSVAVAVVAVAAVLAGMVGTANAMFLSGHDFDVLLWVALVAGVVATTAGAVVGTALTSWSHGLQDEARRFGESGEFRSGHRGPVEFQGLADELARTSRKLRESRARETRLEESRRELVAWVSHDLRTPLAGLRAMTEALEDGLAEDPSRYHRQIRAEVDRMVRMVDDLFELSRIHAGNLRLSLEPVMVGDLVSEAIASADPVARAHGVRLGGGVEDGLEVVADSAELSRVVANLVMNAIRHTPSDGLVEVVGRAAPGGVDLLVTDGCGGLTEEDMARAFDVAWQGSAARTPDVAGVFGSGAGLGLAIVKGIVEAHHGTVSVVNHAPGCRFGVHLPVPA